MIDTIDIYTPSNQSQDISFAPVPQTFDHSNLVPVSFFRNIECTGRLCRHCGDRTGNPMCNNHFDEFNKHIAWSEFVGHLQKFAKNLYKDKQAAPLFAPTIFLKERAKRRDGSYYQGWRCEPNATTSRMAVIDLDDDFSFPRIEQFLIERNLEGLLWTTASHRLAAPRLRLLIPYAEEVDKEMHEIAGRSIVATIEPGYKPNDTSKFGIESLAYVPGIYGFADENKFIHVRGRVLSAEEWFVLGGLSLEEAKAERPEPTWTGSLSSNAQWSYDGPLEKYLATGHHRHNALCSFANGVACCAIHAGYDLSVNELASIIDDVQRSHHGKSPRDYREIGRLAIDALAYAEHVLDTPAYILREQAWDRRTAEIQAEIDDCQPNWPEGWREQMWETISHIQQLRSQSNTMKSYGKHFDPQDIDNDEFEINSKRYNSTTASKETVWVKGGLSPRMSISAKGC